MRPETKRLQNQLRTQRNVLYCTGWSQIRRIMVPSGSCSEEDYTPDIIATEWVAWICGCRNVSPTVQERGQDASEREQEHSEREKEQIPIFGGNSPSPVEPHNPRFF
uniref:Uncharacterized protein n=1 Tax=Eptatretus burgeri TaxID=7764 RepID=A0A8C4R7K5_EPTBU